MKIEVVKVLGTKNYGMDVTQEILLNGVKAKIELIEGKWLTKFTLLKDGMNFFDGDKMMWMSINNDYDNDRDLFGDDGYDLYEATENEKEAYSFLKNLLNGAYEKNVEFKF